MKQVIKKIGASIVRIIIVVLVLLSIVISISSITAKANNGVPDLFGYTPFTVQSESMNPTICQGDYIFVEKCDTETLQVGDVISYFTIIQGQRVVNTHRIVNVYNDNGIIQYQTQGDNKETNPEPDEILVSPGDVIGKFTGTRIPVMGSVIDFLSTQTGFFVVILLPVLLFTLYQIYNLVAIILHNHKVDTVNAVNETTSDAVKEAIIAEYLAKQKLASENAESAEDASENAESTEDASESAENNESASENENAEDKNEDTEDRSEDTEDKND